jgi:hypothetical protein
MLGGPQTLTCKFCANLVHGQGGQLHTVLVRNADRSGAFCWFRTQTGRQTGEQPAQADGLRVLRR